MSIIMNILDEYDFKDAQFNKHIKSANLILKEKNEQLVDGRCNRSNWLDENAADLPALLANKIIHICYNYTVEDSINNVLKHYDENSFLADFINRVKLYCLLDSSSEPREYDIVTKKEWNILVRFAEYKSKAKTSDSGSATYERIYLDERRKWKKFFFMQTLKSIGLAFIYALLFLVVELGLSLAESSLSFLPESAIISSITSVLLIGVLGSLINYLLKHFNRGNDIPDILENIVNIFIHFIDLCRVLGGKNNAYRLP